MCSFHYVSDISGYTEVLYQTKTERSESDTEQNLTDNYNYPDVD